MVFIDPNRKRKGGTSQPALILHNDLPSGGWGDGWNGSNPSRVPGCRRGGGGAADHPPPPTATGAEGGDRFGALPQASDEGQHPKPPLAALVAPVAARDGASAARPAFRPSLPARHRDGREGPGSHRPV